MTCGCPPKSKCSSKNRDLGPLRVFNRTASTSRGCPPKNPNAVSICNITRISGAFPGLLPWWRVLLDVTAISKYFEQDLLSHKDSLLKTQAIRMKEDGLAIKKPMVWSGRLFSKCGPGKTWGFQRSFQRVGEVKAISSTKMLVAFFILNLSQVYRVLCTQVDFGDFQRLRAVW